MLDVFADWFNIASEAVISEEWYNKWWFTLQYNRYIDCFVLTEK